MPHTANLHGKKVKGYGYMSIITLYTANAVKLLTGRPSYIKYSVHTIRYDTKILTCAQKWTSSQLSLPHDTVN